MPSSIWTQSGDGSNVRPLSAEPWRVVEAQHRIATRKLVDSDAEQVVLEQLLEAAKPPAPGSDRLHYLLFTPFRYPPLTRGSRFGSRWEPGIWYGSESLSTAFAEVAYYRLLFLEGTDADLGVLETDLSAFQARVATPRGIDLTGRRFERWQRLLASKTSYAATQPLGSAMRESGVEACRYRSARDPQRGANLAILSPGAFAAARPAGLQTWHSVAIPSRVEFTKRDYFEQRHWRFERSVFTVGGTLPAPALAG